MGLLYLFSLMTFSIQTCRYTFVFFVLEYVILAKLQIALTSLGVQFAKFYMKHPSWCGRYSIYKYICRSQWPRGLRRSFAAARLLRSWVRIPPGSWIFVHCECCVLSVRGICDELITRPEESYRLWCVVVCDLETSRMRRP